jgi:hypothetical protein
MKRFIINSGWALVAVLCLIVCMSSASAETNDRIIFDKEFGVTEKSGDGYNGEWYYYPYSGEWIMWFRNDLACVPEHDFRIKLRVATVITEFSDDDPNDWYNLNIHHGWTMPGWSDLGHGTPPLPDKMTNYTEQSQYLFSRPFITMDPNEGVYPWLEIQEYRDDVTVPNYYPQWIYISTRGRNVGVFSHFNYFCDDGTTVDPGEEPYGACCHRQSGDCYMSQQANCPSPNEWLGEGSTCSDCQKLGPIWDYGDAPSTYPVLLIDYGPTHIIHREVFLGEEVTAEADGKPNGSATGDSDDGVILPSQLVPGVPAIIKLTASIYGVINAWVDFNRDGDWDDAGEKVFTDEPVQPGQNIMSMPVLATASAGTSYARFRFSTTGGLAPTGQSPNGEVEDYQVRIVPSEIPPSPEPGPNPIGMPASPTMQYSNKWRQPADGSSAPHIIGWPEVSRFKHGPILADDWLNDGPNPVLGIRWWGSFAEWTEMTLPAAAPTTFHIGIWTDNYYANVPSTLIWEKHCTDWSWAFAGPIEDPQDQTGGESCFEFVHVFSQDQWFQPTADTNTRYWLSISAVYNTRNPSNAWGWMTRENQYAEAAIRIGETVSLSLNSVRLGSPNLGDTFHRGMTVMHPYNEAWDMSFDLLSTRPGPGSGAAGAEVDDQVAAGTDLNGDGVVDIQDISMLMRLWLDD